jgi:hypothetical protein
MIKDYTQRKNILNSIQLKTTNPFCNNVSKLNYLVELIHNKYLVYGTNYYMDDFLLSSFDDTKHFVLESKIIELITKYYPNDIVKTDDLIDMYHNYVKLSHQQNDIKVIDNNLTNNNSENDLTDNNSENDLTDNNLKNNNCENDLTDNDSEDSLSDELNNELNISDSDSIDDDTTDSEVESVSMKTKKKSNYL